MQKIDSMAVRAALLAEADANYAAFQAKLIPNIAPERIIGVRMPVLRRMAKQSAGADYAPFCQALPHYYHEENTLQGLIIAQNKDITQCLEQLEQFLPYVDNWATCDVMVPRVLRAHSEMVYRYIEKWLQDSHAYTVRFALVCLLTNYLDSAFSHRQLDMVAKLNHSDYYVRMAQAWYLSYALVKQYDVASELIAQQSLDKWLQNKTIQKACESYRLSDERKSYLRGFKIK